MFCDRVKRPKQMGPKEESWKRDLLLLLGKSVVKAALVENLSATAFSLLQKALKVACPTSSGPLVSSTWGTPTGQDGLLQEFPRYQYQVPYVLFYAGDASSMKNVDFVKDQRGDFPLMGAALLEHLAFVRRAQNDEGVETLRLIV